MSKMNKAPVCYPPQFPLEGRLSHSAGQIQHNLQGGGYPPGDQGKAVSDSLLAGDSFLLSQIALNDLDSEAFICGAYPRGRWLSVACIS